MSKVDGNIELTEKALPPVELTSYEGLAYINPGYIQQPIAPTPNIYVDLASNSPPPDYEEIYQNDKNRVHPYRESTEVKSGCSPCVRYALLVLLVLLISGALAAVICGILFAVNDGDKTTLPPTSTQSTSEGPTQSTTPQQPTWGAWTGWGECSATCGGGEQTRSRECEPAGESCRGTDIQGQPCNLHVCPGPDYGEWSSWSGWSDCSTSCGEDGVQTRVRRCDKESTEQLDCPGDVQYTDNRTCNRFDCPTCSRSCPGGGTAEPPDCDRCVCQGNPVTARVVSTTSKPLQVVTVSDVLVPSVQLALTDSLGEFTIADGCNGVILQFERYDLITTTAEISGSLTDVTMERMERLDISQHPEPKERLIGDSVMLCCEATGNPLPDYYEWFKDGAVIKGDVGTGMGTLVLENLEESDSGSYQCRASNDHGSIRSDSATLKVKDNPEKFCSVYPGVNVITLPVGCEQEGGSLELDVGGCKADTCPGQDEGGATECSEQGKYCCGPTGMQMINVQCRGFKLPVYMVTECGCIVCPEPTISVLGQVLDLNSNKPISTASIWINDTDYNVNTDGKFSIQIPAETKRLAITVKESTGNYAENSKVVYISKKTPRVYYTDVYLFPYIEQSNINPGDESLVILGKNQPFGQVYVPANSIYTLNGQRFTGASVNVKTGIVDPRNFTDILHSPGDFTSISDRGFRERLKSYGMFSLRLTDPVSGEQLQLKDKVQVVLDNSNMHDEVDEDGNPIAKLWTLNRNSGNWEFGSSMQTEDSTFLPWRNNTSMKHRGLFSDIIIGDIEIIGDEWYNFDGQSNRACYSKVRLFQNNMFKNGSQLTGGTVTTVALRNDGSGEKLYADVADYTAYSDVNYPGNGYCVVGFCELEPGDIQYEGYIIAEHDGQRLHAADEKSEAYYIGIDDDTAAAIEYKAIEDNEYPGVETKFSIPKVPQDKGPFYNYEGGVQHSETCSAATMGDNHFRFYKDDALSNLCAMDEAYITHEAVYDLPDNQLHLNWLAWFSESHIEEGTNKGMFDVCYIKAIVTNGIGHVFEARSHVGNCAHPTSNEVQVGDLFGVDQQCPSQSPQALCFEIKYPGVSTEGHNKITCEETDETYITVGEAEQFEPISCELTSISRGLLFLQWERIELNRNEFRMNLEPDHAYGKDYGIYCSMLWNSPDEARASAYQMCANGGADRLDLHRTAMTPDNPALEFHCG